MTPFLNQHLSVVKLQKINIKGSLLLAGMLLISFTATLAQGNDPFAEKKDRKPTTNIQQRLTPLKIPFNTSRSSARVGATGSVNFQLNKPLSRNVDLDSYQHRVVKKGENGLPIFISSTPKNQQSVSRVAKLEPETASLNYLKEISSLIKIEKPGQEFTVKNLLTDQLGETHVKMQQVYQGIKIYGKEVVVHLGENHDTRFNGRNIPTPANINTEASLSLEDAQAAAMADVGTFSRSSKTNTYLQKLLEGQRHEHNPELVIYEHPQSREMHLTWHVTVFPNILERWEYFIDARDGSVVHKFNHTCSIDGPGIGNANDLNGVSRELNTYVVDDVHHLVDASREMFNEAASSFPDNGVGVIMTLDLQDEPLNEGTSVFHVTSLDNTWTDAAAVSAHYNAEVAYEYFRNTFNRNSINGSGGNIYSIVNVADDDGAGLDNAFWNGTAMFYGNGNIGFTPLAGALDVGGHEMSHGVIENTANLVYQNQSGAINESFADVFGVMIDRDDWLLGEDVVTDLFSSGALRSLEDPHNGGNNLGDRGFQPKHMSEMFTGSQDNGGVHINSGIPNHAFFLFATEVGNEIAEQVYYRALTVYLTASSQFIDLRLSVIQSAADLHGEDSGEVQAAKDAFDAVGILDGAPTDTNPELPVLEGDDLVLFYDLLDTDPTTLYIYDVANDSYQDISTTEVLRRPTITDDGSLALFVKPDNTLQAIELSEPYNEEEISPDPIWFNIAISKDGSRIAAVSNEQDGNIYVTDVNSEEVATFELFNPTTAEGVTTAEVLYADAIEWDFTGQYLVYDALNAIQNNSGDDIEYWDVGFIKVWDNAKNEFGDGSIQKLFTSLPDGVSIGNPSFARNSPNVLVFDMVDANEDEFYILSANIETGDLQTVFNNEKIGYPNYSRLDDAIVFDARTEGGDNVAAIIEMQEDKLTPDGSASVFIEDAKWVLWFSQGSRQVLSDEKDILSYDFVNLESLTEVSITGNNINVLVPEETDVSALVASFTHSQKATVQIGDLKQISGITKNNFTDPLVYTVFAQDGSSKNYTITVVKPDPITGLEDAKTTDNIRLYPNPVTNKVTVSFENKTSRNADIYIVDAMGRVLENHHLTELVIGENKRELFFGDRSSGTYFIKIHTVDHIKINRIVKK